MKFVHYALFGLVSVQAIRVTQKATSLLQSPTGQQILGYCDSDRDQLLSKDELVACFERHGGKEQADYFLKHWEGDEKKNAEQIEELLNKIKQAHHANHHQHDDKEMQKYQDIIHMCDANKNGMLSLGEAEECMRKFKKPEREIEMLKQAWGDDKKEIDAKGLARLVKKLEESHGSDGSDSESEKDESHKYQQILDHCDANKNGMLSLGEAEECMKKFGKSQGEIDMLKKAWGEEKEVDAKGLQAVVARMHGKHDDKEDGPEDSIGQKILGYCDLDKDNMLSKTEAVNCMEKFNKPKSEIRILKRVWGDQEKLDAAGVEAMVKRVEVAKKSGGKDDEKEQTMGEKVVGYCDTDKDGMLTKQETVQCMQKFKKKPEEIEWIQKNWGDQEKLDAAGVEGLIKRFMAAGHK